MASTEPKRHPRRGGSWLTYIGIGFMLPVVYVGSIGPLAGLEAQRCFRLRTWEKISLFYAPILRSWKHGPDWWAGLLSGYTSYFHAPQGCGPHFATYYFATHNKAQAYRYMKKRFVDDGIREPDLSRRMQEFERRRY